MKMFSCEQRSHEGFVSLAYSANSDNLPDHGVKGLCFLNNINSFDALKSNVIDYMHSLCLGVIKKTITLILNEKNYRDKFLHLNECILDLKIPKNIPYHCLDLTNLKKWKAKDFRFFLFYICPLLKDININRIHLLFFYLREGILLLFEQTIEPNISEKSMFFLKKFILLFSSTFQEYELTPNFHDLVHFPAIYNKSGPLFEYSAFNFEHLNGRLKKLCKGNKRLNKQLLFKFKNFVESCHNNDIKNSSLLEFIENISSKKMWKPTSRASENSYVSGKGFSTQLNISFLSLLPFSVSHIKKVVEYKRAIINSLMISTNKYDSNKKNCNSFFISKDDKQLLSV